MKWIDIKQKPEEDQSIVAINDFKKIIAGNFFYEDDIPCCANGDEFVSHIVFWFPMPEIPDFNWK